MAKKKVVKPVNTEEVDTKVVEPVKNTPKIKIGNNWNCIHFNNFYCMHHKKFVLTKKSMNWCHNECTEFTEKKG